MMTFKTLTLRGSWFNDGLTAALERRKASMSELLALMAQGDIAPPVEATFGFGDVMRAIELAESSGCGKITLVG